MDRVALGRSGLKISEIGLGMWQAGERIWGAGEGYSDEDCVKAMLRAHELGVNLIDTAEGYGKGRSEEVVGRALKEIGREHVVVATKTHHVHHDHVLRACDDSLKRLGLKDRPLPAARPGPVAASLSAPHVPRAGEAPRGREGPSDRGQQLRRA